MIIGITIDIRLLLLIRNGVYNLESFQSITFFVENLTPIPPDRTHTLLYIYTWIISTTTQTAL